MLVKLVGYATANKYQYKHCKSQWPTFHATSWWPNMRSKVENLAFILNIIWQALMLTTSTEHVPAEKPVQTSMSSSVAHNSFYRPPFLLSDHMQHIQRHMLQITNTQPNISFKSWLRNQFFLQLQFETTFSKFRKEFTYHSFAQFDAGNLLDTL
jgi:hypothetical protein